MKADQPSLESFAHAAWFLRCAVAAIQAVAEVEAGRLGAFNDDGSPVILYERHHFSRLTNGKFDRSHPALSNPVGGGYGTNSEQHVKLDAAQKLDRNAALMSCSWGLFQVMGSNYRRAGFESVQDMVNAAYRDVDEHLRMFVWFVATDAVLTKAVRDLTSTDERIRAAAAENFARRYNGPAYRMHNYHGRILAAVERLLA